MDLSTDMTYAARSFIESLPEEERNSAMDAFNSLCTLEIYPIDDPYASVGDLQVCSDNPNSVAEFNLDDKLLLILDKFENDKDDYRKSLFFLLQFYTYLKNQCPDFQIPIGNMDAQKWIEYTTIFARVLDCLQEESHKSFLDILKQFTSKAGEQVKKKIKRRR